jgi:hypothetical protein
MDTGSLDELRRTYLVARLNAEKSERCLGQLARVLARRAIALRLVAIATGQPFSAAGEDDASPFPHTAPPPVPQEVSDALRELREWRDAVRRAYLRIPEAERVTLARPPTPQPVEASTCTRLN